MASRSAEGARAAALSWILTTAVGISCTTEVVNFDHRDASTGAEVSSRSGTGFSRYVYYVCCKSDAGMSCVKDVAGGLSSCESGDTWKAYVAQKCQAQGMFVGEVSVYSDCNPASDLTDASVDARCFSTENQDTRCTICGSVAAPTTTSCETLDCKPIDVPSGKCQSCHWSDHPQNECVYCLDGTGGVQKDSCHGQLSTP